MAACLAMCSKLPMSNNILQFQLVKVKEARFICFQFMKRSLDSSSSLGALNLMSICPPTEEQKPESNHVYSREFQSMMVEEEEELELELESESVGQKKRRLSVEQVKALEKDFEVDNKLEPERKAKLAHQLGLQPRQVAVWFQNRRARWKTKQLERDYAVLKSNYDSLKQNAESLRCENQALCNEIRNLKSKLNEEKDPEKEEALGSESDNSATEVGLTTTTTTNAWAVDFPSDSDSSAILNVAPASGFLPSDQLLISSSSITCLNLLAEAGATGGAQKGGSLYVKMEDDDELFSEEACTFFSDDQAPTLHWEWDTPHNVLDLKHQTQGMF